MLIIWVNTLQAAAVAEALEVLVVVLAVEVDSLMVMEGICAQALGLAALADQEDQQQEALEGQVTQKETEDPAEAEVL
jgi:hypothetical protein